MASERKIQVKTAFSGWATYEKSEGEAVADAFREAGIPVETREVPAKDKPHD